MSQTHTHSTTRLQIAGLRVQDLAAQFGTPTYLYEAATIVGKIAELHEFDTVRYAMKACSNLAILDLVRQHGGLVDTVSAGEIQRALAAGYSRGDTAAEADETSPPEIVYTADIFDHEALKMVVEHGVHVNVGSADMIDQLGKVSPGGDITLRINPGFGHGHSQKTNTGGEQSKHGIWHKQVQDCLQAAARYDLTISGLHMHIGSGTDLEHLAQVCQVMDEVAHEVGDSIHSISAGGGLPVPYRDDESYVDLARYFGLWNTIRRSLEDDFSHKVSLEIEPGRFLVAESGYLLTEIRAVKRMGKNLFYLVDAGFNNLARPILYGAYHPISVVPVDDQPRALVDVIVGGPLCESGDIFTQQEGGFVCSRQLPEARVGEFLVLECAGAYGAVMGSNYNSKPLAAEVLIVDGRAELVRQRQSNEDLFQDERIPGR
jgi:diaminopimelate decarboxylase